MHSASKPLYRAFCVVMAILLLFPAMALAEPNVPGDVTVVHITAPTQASPVYVKAGEKITVTFDADGQDDGVVRYWLGGTIKLLEEAVTLPIAKTIQLTIPAGTAEGLYDLSIDAKQTGQANWIQGKQEGAVIVDNHAPVVGLDALIQPNGGEFLHVGDVYHILWDPTKVNDANLNCVKLELWVAGAFHSVLANCAANTGDFAWTVTPMVTQQAKIKLIAVDMSGQMASDMSDGYFAIFTTDNTLPAVNVTAPLDNAYVTTNTVAVAATAEDLDSGITKVVFEYSKDNGATWVAIGTDVAAPYEASLNVTALPDGTVLIIKATAFNGVGAFASDTNGNILIDRSKPAATVTAPTNGQIVPSCTQWTATATDAQSGIDHVLFRGSFDGTTWFDVVSDATAPYDQTVCDGDLVFWMKAVAYNKAGLMAESAVVKFEYDSTDPTILPTTLLQPNGGEGLQIGTVYAIKWTKADITDKNLGAKPITLWLSIDNGANWAQIGGPVENTGAFNWTVSGVPSTQAWIKVRATDVVGNFAEDMSDAAFTIFAVDTTPPTVSITAPADGAWFDGGSITFKVAAADPQSGITQVQLWEKTPGGDWHLIYTWNATPYEHTFALNVGYNGDAWYKASAVNGVGLSAESSSITLHFDNTDPTVSLTQPLAGSLISGTAYEFMADAADSMSGVAKVVFEVQPFCAGAWSVLGTATAAPYKVVVNTTTLPDGDHCFRAVATDKVGNEGFSAVVTAKIANTYSIVLRAGWNLVSTPLVPYDTNIANAFAGLPVKQVATFIWSSGKLVQQTWVPGAGGTLKTFKDGQGYWVEMKSGATLVVKGRYLGVPPNAPPSYNVLAGWNLIGVTLPYGVNSEWYDDYLGYTLGDAAETIYWWNPAGYYETDWQLDGGKGYWLALSKAGTIYP